jgi:hypothetical protein
MRVETLSRAKLVDLLRLAKWLKLSANGLSHSKVLELIHYATTITDDFHRF